MTRGRHNAPGQGQRGSADLIVVAGLSGVIIATGSKLLEVIHLPSSDVSVAVFGVALVGLGLIQRYRLGRSCTEIVDEMPAVAPVLPIDLLSLTGDIAAVLAHLRRDYGLAYRTSTWLDDVLPTVGFLTAQPELVRDLIAVGALDVGGVRADVTALSEAYSTAAIVEAGSAILVALGNIGDTCAQSEMGIGKLPRRHGAAHAAAGHTRSFEYAHLLDPVRSATVSCNPSAFDDIGPVADHGPVLRLDESDAVHDEELVAASRADELFDASEGSTSAHDPFGHAAPTSNGLAPLDTDWMSLGEVDVLLAAPASKPVAPMMQPVALITATDPFEFLGVETPAPIETAPVDDNPEAHATARPPISRFATAGLDDDRLPMIRRRRGKRS